jgi:hypothetical protein
VLLDGELPVAAFLFEHAVVSDRDCEHALVAQSFEQL